MLNIHNREAWRFLLMDLHLGELSKQQSKRWQLLGRQRKALQQCAGQASRALGPSWEPGANRAPATRGGGRWAGRVPHVETPAWQGCVPLLPTRLDTAAGAQSKTLRLGEQAFGTGCWPRQTLTWMLKEPDRNRPSRANLLAVRGCHSDSAACCQELGPWWQTAQPFAARPGKALQRELGPCQERCRGNSCHPIHPQRPTPLRVPIAPSCPGV